VGRSRAVRIPRSRWALAHAECHREYQTTIMWALLDAVADAHQYADVQLVETPWTLVADVVAYGVQGKSPALTTAAIQCLEQGFAAVGTKASILYDLAGDGSTCCVVDPEVHDPEKVVARMKAPVVRYQGRIFIRR